MNIEIEAHRQKSGLRKEYESEVEAITKQFGSLEEIRAQLGLSQRQFCKLLLVDPSSWNRWRKNGAPPAIWRSIGFFLLLKQEEPLLARYFAKDTPKESANPTPELAEKIQKLNRDILFLKTLLGVFFVLILGFLAFN